MRLCPYCLQELKSRGERVRTTAHEYNDTICEWCEEITDEYFIVK